MTRHPGTDLADRYGVQSPARRRTVIAASGVVGLVALAWLTWVIWFQSSPEVQSSMRSFRIDGDHTVQAEFAVTTSSEDVVADCLLRAFSADHSVVGERNVEVSGVDGQAQRAVTFRTEREATSVELVGCSTGEQTRRR